MSDKPRIPMKGGDEFDALSTRSKGLCHWKPGERKKLKRKYNKRLRRQGREVMSDE